RAVVLSDGDELTVDELPQIAVDADGPRDLSKSTVAPMSAAPPPRSIPVPPAPVMLGAERTVPQTVAIGAGGLGILAVTAQGELRSLEAMEADRIRLAVGRCRGRAEAARSLGIGRSPLYRKMRELGLETHPREGNGRHRDAREDRNGSFAMATQTVAGTAI